MGIVQLIRDRVGHGPIYLRCAHCNCNVQKWFTNLLSSSLDIDVIDPSLAPATGTPEPGTVFSLYPHFPELTH
jgi:Arginase family